MISIYSEERHQASDSQEEHRSSRPAASGDVCFTDMAARFPLSTPN